MTFHIKGFGDTQTASAVTVQAEPQQKITIPKKSLVKVRFPEKGMALTYYNDQFDLKIGDRVYVDGKLEVCKDASQKSPIISKSRFPIIRRSSPWWILTYTANSIWAVLIS